MICGQILQSYRGEWMYIFQLRKNIFFSFGDVGFSFCLISNYIKDNSFKVMKKVMENILLFISWKKLPLL